MTMRDRYYAYVAGTGTLATDNVMYSEMVRIPVSTASASAGTAILQLTLTSDWVIPAFLATPQSQGATPLSPVLEFLCVDLVYPTTPMPTVSSGIMAISDPLDFLLRTTPSFYGVVSRTENTNPSIARVVAADSSRIGDRDSADDTGSLLVQLDLPASPSKTLGADTILRFTTPLVMANATHYAFTPDSGSLKCYLGATYANPTGTVAQTARDRYYKYLNGTDTLAGDGVIYSALSPLDMSTSVIDISSTNATLLEFSITTGAAWTIPAFLSASQSDGATPLIPVLELLCVRLVYPPSSVPADADLPMSVGDASVSPQLKLISSASLRVVVLSSVTSMR
jgi:hypothetical protein